MLFDTVSQASRQATVQNTSYVVRSRVVTLRLDRLGQAIAAPALSSPTLVLNLFDDVVLSAMWERIERDALGFTSWIGRVAGDPLSTITLTRRDNIVSGQVLVGGRTYQVRSIGSGLYQIDEIDVRLLPQEGEPILTTDQLPPAPAPREALGRPQVAAVADILVFYTPALQARLGEAPTIARIAQAVADANTAFSRSQLDGSLRLVGIEALPFAESSSIGDDLDAFASNVTVQQRRDSAGADIVALVADAPYNSSCGIAFLGPSRSVPFSLVPEPCFNNYSLAHEIGHNLGAGHAPDDAGSGGWHPYSAAYKSPNTSPRFRTVMAYGCIAPDCPRVLHYSSPQALYQNNATGTANQDNARTIREAFPLVEAFRASTPSTEPPSAPRNPQASISAGTVYLSWQPPATGEVSNYRLLVGSSSGASNILNRSVGMLLALTAPAPNGTYYVRIVAENVNGTGPPSEELVIPVGADQNVPGPPRLLVGQAFGNTVELTWSPPSVGSTPPSYRIEVGSAPGAADLAVFVTSSPYWYQGNVPSGLYYLRIRSHAAGAASAPSNEVSLRVGPAPGCQPPGVPSSLFFTHSGNVITLAWSAPQNGTPPLSYLIEAGSASGSSNLFNGHTGPATTISSAVARGMYFIRVRATNACGTSGPSNQVVIQVP